MTEDVLSYLALFAEIALATVALSGIIMVLAMSGMRVTQERVTQIAAQLRMALIVTVLSLLPLLLNSVGMKAEIFWRLCTGIYLGTICYVTFRGLAGKPTYSFSGKQRAVVGISGVSGIVLLPTNLWLATAWPYLAQLTIALVTSMGLFLNFITQVLIEKSERP